MAHARQFWLAALALGAAACVDLNVDNPSIPNDGQVLRTPAEVEAAVSTTYQAWFNATYPQCPGLMISVVALQHSEPGNHCYSETFSRLPREALVNVPMPREWGRAVPGDHSYYIWTLPWFRLYGAVTGAAEVLKALARPEIATQLAPNDLRRDRAFTYFALGMGHASIAAHFDQGVVVDETIDTYAKQRTQPYPEVMAAAIGYFDQALNLASEGGFNIPKRWIATDADLSAADLARVTHSMKARYLVEVARTPAERAAVDWARVIAEVDAGITSSFVQNMDPMQNWYNEVVDYSTSPGWGQSPYFIWGMADQSGAYQLWVSTPPTDRAPIIGGRDILIVSPDLRFPRGSTVAEQQAGGGKYVVVPSPELWDAYPQDPWFRPERGRWRWSYYMHIAHFAYNRWREFHLAEIPQSEMDMLKAEGLLRLGDRAGAAALVNKTRVGVGGLNPTDAAGTNTSCVPKLPDGRCGDLFEMIKWEKRVEGAFLGLGGVPWYYDGRGWGDLYKGTPLQYPIPCGELQLMGIECYTFGGPTQPSSAPVSSYAYPGET